MTDRLIRITTALAVVAVAVVAAIISYQHAYELLRSHGESGVTARLMPFTMDGLIWAASMAVLDASRRNQPVPRLAAWSLGVGIVATVGAQPGAWRRARPAGALVSAWPALALVGSMGAAGRHRVSSLLGVPIERREFLLLGGAVAAGAGLAGCTSTRRGSAPPRGSRSASPPAGPSPAVSPPGGAEVQRGAQVVHGSRSRARVALTFHGQGPASMADALLAEAERSGARVTVLAVGTWLEQYPQMARRVVRGGHDLGNHTLHHLDIAAMDAAGAYAEIAGCALRLRALTGSIGRWFRPSQTRYATALIEQAARKAGYQTCVSYDVDSLDYTDPGPDAVVATVLGSVRPGSIISLHLGHPGTVTALPAILHGLTGRRLRPVTLTELLST